jgi:hypothetical protein
MLTPDYQFYTSGVANRPDAIAACQTKTPWGTSVTWLKRSPFLENLCFQSLEDQTPVFVDSGAFHTATTGGTTNWDTVFSTYFHLSLNTPKPAYLTIVAPDVLGNQSESLTLLHRYRSELVHLHKSGVRILIPIQHGPRSIEAYLESAQLSPTQFGIALPSNRNAYPPANLENHLKEASITDLHLLGISAANQRFENLFGSAARAQIRTLSSDSNRIRTMVGPNTAITTLQHNDEIKRSMETELDHEAYHILHNLTHDQIHHLIHSFAPFVQPPADSQNITSEQLSDFIMVLDSFMPGSIENWMKDHLDSHAGIKSLIRQQAVRISLKKDTRSRQITPSSQIPLL